MAEPPIHAQGHNVLPPSAISFRTNSSSVADFLAENGSIGCKFKLHKGYRSHYINLRIPQMFEALVSLYTHIFAIHWDQFRSFLDTFSLPENYQGNPQRYASTIYISSWFLDLYVSNRETCRKLFYAAYCDENYNLDIFLRSEEYDAYLVKLSSAIRPGFIRLNGEATLYIPRLELVDMHPLDENYFNVQGWVINDSCLLGLIHIFKERKLIKMEKLNFVSTGRASWLFDWHDDATAYAWFVAKGNYDLDDVAVAYILGVACTPKLGPRDCGEWQYCLANAFPAQMNLVGFERAREIAYYVAIKKRVIESEPWTIPDHLLDLLSIKPKVVTLTPERKRQRMEDFEPKKEVEDEGDNTMANLASSPALACIQAAEYTVGTPRITRYRLIDYAYHSLVIPNTDNYLRREALKMMLRR